MPGVINTFDQFGMRLLFNFDFILSSKKLITRAWALRRITFNPC
jgi:hypothetical protein